MKSIVVFIPYFGKLPKFYNVWKETALRNDTIRFILFTDDRTVCSEGNIQIVHMAWEEMVRTIQAHYPFRISLKAPYKLCDFKPAFGEIFGSYVDGYDFWGYCDIDLLLGNIRKFIIDDVLETHDRVFYNGHISLYRNCEKMNTLYRYSESGYPAVNHQECFSNSRSFYFDEFGGMYTKCLCNEIAVFDDLSLRRDPIIAEEKFYWEKVDVSTQFVILWENGHLFAIEHGKRTELVYAHFFRRKFFVPELSEKVDNIIITPKTVRFNDTVIPADFEKSESAGYRAAYQRDSLRRTLKNNGLIGTLKKRKRDRDFWQYRREVERQARQK